MYFEELTEEIVEDFEERNGHVCENITEDEVDSYNEAMNDEINEAFFDLYFEALPLMGNDEDGDLYPHRRIYF